MRRFSRRTLISVLAVLGAVALAACSSTNSGGGSGQNSKQYVIGWANPQGKQLVFGAFSDALNAAAARTNVKVISLDAGANPATQVSDIQTFITKKVDAIIVYPVAADALAPVLAKASQAGIKIIGYNAVIPVNGRTPAVPAPYATDLDMGLNVTGAQTAGRFVANALGGNGTVVGIKIPVPVPALTALLENYQTSVSQGRPGIRWLGTLPDATDDLAGAESSMADAITRYHGKIDAVMSYTDIGGIGAAKALSSAGITGTVIIGQQGCQTGIDAVRDGVIQGDIDVEPWMEGVYAFAMTRDVLAGKPVPPFVVGPTNFITKDNIDSYVPWSRGISEIKSGKVALDVDFHSGT